MKHGKVQKVEEAIVFNEMNQPVRVYRITFTVKDQGPFTVDVEKEGFTAEKGRAAVEAEAEKIASLLGG